eukprot:350196-Chlamydomonas_euryale.AAC.3
MPSPSVRPSVRPSVLGFAHTSDGLSSATVALRPCRCMRARGQFKQQPGRARLLEPPGAIGAIRHLRAVQPACYGRLNSSMGVDATGCCCQGVCFVTQTADTGYRHLHARGAPDGCRRRRMADERPALGLPDRSARLAVQRIA